MSASVEPRYHTIHGRVLLADDSEIVRDLIAEKLRGCGLDVVCAHDGQAALALLNQEAAAVDLAILDVMMPGANGFEVTRQMRSQEGTRNIPVLLLTSLDTTDDKVSGLEAGADDFITKTVSDAELVARVRSLIALGYLRKTVSSRAGGLAQLLRPTAEPLAELTRPGARGPNARVVIIHEDAKIRSALAGLLQDDSHLVRVVSSPERSLSEIQRMAPDLAVMSYHAAVHEQGPRILAALQSWDAPPAIFVVDEIEDTAHRIAAYDQGAEDYVVATAPGAEIRARISSLVRRCHRVRTVEDARDRAVVAAITDPVTGLYNRSYFEQAYPQEISRTRRYGQPTALVMLDLDRFKRVNDAHGHPAGDLVLRETARRLSRVVRATDIAARFGGEEFILLLPHTSSEEAARTAERLRRILATEPVDLPTGEQLVVTASFGVAAATGAQTRGEDLLERVDRALYTAKRKGRNRVHCARQKRSEIPTGPALSVGAESAPNAEGYTSPLATRLRNVAREMRWLLSEDLDSPLAAIRAASSLLANHMEAGDPLFEMVQQLRAAAETMAERVGDLAGQLEGDGPPVDPAAVAGHEKATPALPKTGASGG